MNIYFSDFFDIDPSLVDNYGAFNISLINDLPLFIDPFLLFGSSDKVYKDLHNEILKYLSFLKAKSEKGITNRGEIKAWYSFSEVKQNWFGYSKVGNSGSGLGEHFGKTFSTNMHIVFDDLGREQITQSSHLEKAGLFEIGVGKDNISDFTTNLIKEFLLDYTSNFANKYINEKFLKKIKVNKVYFDYKLERWQPKTYNLPYIFNDFVILTPKDILTKDENWINSNDLRGDFSEICNSIQNEQLRTEIQNYFNNILPKKQGNKRNSQREMSEAIHLTIKKYPEIIKWYVKSKEENKSGAKNISEQKVQEVENIFIKNITKLVELLSSKSNFYSIEATGNFTETLERVICAQKIIEEEGGGDFFYLNYMPINRESDLQVIYRLFWYAVDNVGIITNAPKQNSFIEFKLAANGKLAQYFKKRADKIKQNSLIVAVLCFSDFDLLRTRKILNDLELNSLENVVLIDIDYMKKKSNKIYFSYAWGDKKEKKNSREDIINSLYDSLNNDKYSLKRDKMDLGYRGLISDFMKDIGQGDLVIVAISDKYLKSPYCMYELYEIYRNSKLNKSEFVNKLFPIRVEDIDLKTPKTLNKYYDYWEKEEKAWAELIKKRISQVGKEQFAEYDKVKQINLKFGDLVSFVSDMNALNMELIAKDDFKEIKTAIDKKIAKN